MEKEERESDLGLNPGFNFATFWLGNLGQVT